MTERQSQLPRDLLRRPTVVTVGYGIPIVALFATGMLDLSKPATAAIWAVSVFVMGATCAANARRCGRVHCYFTAPFLFAMALLLLLFGFDVRGFAWLTFDLLGNVLGIGTALLWLGSEFAFGRYFSKVHGRDG